MLGRGEQADIRAGGRVRLVRARAPRTAGRGRRAGGPRLDERHVPQRRAAARPAAAPRRATASASATPSSPSSVGEALVTSSPDPSCRATPADPCCASPSSGMPPTSAGSARATRTTSSCARRCSWSPTAWAARRPARSPRRWRSRSFRGGPAGRRRRRGRSCASSQSANRAIHERSRAEEQRAGMGTTRHRRLRRRGRGRGRARRRLARLPAARRRAGAPDPRPLAGRRAGRAAASSPRSRPSDHPQRSVITRALGPEADVEVDVDRFPARAGDVFLLCSDGLTSMVRRGAAAAEMLDASASSLEAAGRELIAAANEAGGRDNITVVLFRLEEVDPPRRRGRRRPPQQETVEPRARGRDARRDARRGGDARCAATVAAARRGATRRGAIAAAARAAGRRRERRARTRRPQAPPPRAHARRRGALIARPRRRARSSSPAGSRRAPSTSSAPTPRRALGDGLPRAALRAAGGHPTSTERYAGSGVTIDAGRRRAPDGLHRPQAALARRRRRPRPQLERGQLDRVSARNRELLALIPASLLVTAGFAASSSSAREVALGRLADLRRRSSSALCLAAHIVLRFTLPHADPYLFPLVAVLACFGLVMIYRIDEDLAREQAQWFVVGLGAVRRDDHLAAARLPRARALPLHDRRRRPRAAAAAARAGHRRAGQRRLPRRRARPDRLPAGRVREDRDRRLPRQPTCATRARCSCRARAGVLGRDDPAAQALRPAARGLGRGDAACWSSSATSARR